MLKVEVIDCLEDNYAFLLVNDKKQAILIDAPEAKPIQKAIDDGGYTLETVLLTHHHNDHMDGLVELNIGGAPIFGAMADRGRMPPMSVYVNAGEHIKQAHEHFTVMGADGHTIGHVAYYFEAAKALFTGDSLMFWGCGRLFEGTAEQMWNTLESFMKLPEETLVYSGHNYGQTNGRFALSLGGYVDRMKARLDKVIEQDKKHEAVVPASLKEEMQTNPFLLARDDAYAKELGIAEMSPLDRFAHIRKLRDSFTG